MKTYKIFIALLIGGSLFISSCSKEWLEVEPKGTTLEANFYRNAAEAFAGLVSVYDPLGWQVVRDYASKLGLLNTASDDTWAGGGAFADRATWEAWNTFTVTPALGPQDDFWGRNYAGINRANTLLSKLEGVPMDEGLKARFGAEAKFLRAYYYFDLVRLFKNIPLITTLLTPDQYYSVQQADPADVFAQIERDLTEAIPYLPETVPGTEHGRVTKGAARALLGKVILWQNDEARMLEAADILRLVNDSPHYDLVDDFNTLFRPDNEFNEESIFEVSHSSVAIGFWGPWPPAGEGHIFTQMSGPRAYVGPIYSAGWGFNPIRVELVDLLRNDPRYRATVANIDSLEQAGVASYEKGYQNTGYFLQKWAPLQEFRSSGGGDPVLEWPNNYIEIRLADTYLMEAEALVRGGGDLNRAQYCLDRVRNRVGLPSVPPTLDNIYHERRLELATEGHRFFDLVRTGRAAEVLAFKGFVEGKHELLPIPLTEMNHNANLIQNPNY